MRKIRLSDTDLELFDIEVSPTDYNFYQKHKDAFKTMFHEQGKPFWTRFVITFRSFTVKHGVIKQMNIDSPKFQNLIDQAFIFIHERFVDAKANIARHFIEDIALLAQSQDKFAGLDSKSFAKDPFYARDTRELFRNFFGMPDQKSSYLKVYILSPVLLRFGGSICRCLIRWVDAVPHDPSDDSYWTPPQPQVVDNTKSTSMSESIMCSSCIDDCSTKYFRERIMGSMFGPKFIDFWKLGDPRVNDQDNPLFAPYCDPSTDWRENLTVDKFREFLYYVTYKYGTSDDKCKECMELKTNRDKIANGCRSAKKKKKKKEKDQVELIKDLKEVRQRIDQLEQKDNLRKEEYEQCIHDIIKDKPRVRQALAEAERQELLEKEKPNSDDKKGKKKKRKKPAGGQVVTHDSIAFPKSVHSTVTGFRVVKTVDVDQGIYEATLTVTSAKSEKEQAAYRERMEESLSQQTENKYLFNCPTLVTKIERLPGRIEWFEGVGFSISVIDFEIEERKETDKWTNFTLMVKGYDEVTIKHVMLKLLVYVGKRKKRTCYGWSMEVDDVVTCILPEELPNMEGVTISILRGVSFEDRLSEREKQSFMQHQPYYKLNTILLQLPPGAAFKIHNGKDGKEKVTKILTTLTKSDAVFTRNRKLFNMWEAYMKGCGPPYMVTELYGRFTEFPEMFELVTLATGEIASQLREQGLKRIDVRYYVEHMNHVTHICQYCKILEFRCDCYQHPIVTPEAEQLINRVIAPSPDDPLPSWKLNLSGKPEYGNAPKVSEDTAEQKINGETEQKNTKKKKKSSSKKKKEKKLAAQQAELDNEKEKTSIIEKAKDKGEKQEAMATVEENGEEDSGQCNTSCLLNYFKQQLQEKEQEIRAAAEFKMRQIINDTKWDKSVKDGMLSDVLGGKNSDVKNSLDNLLDLQEQIKLIEASENAMVVSEDEDSKGDQESEQKHTDEEKANKDGQSNGRQDDDSSGKAKLEVTDVSNKEVLEKSENESTTETVQKRDDQSSKKGKGDNEGDSKEEIKQKGDNQLDEEGKEITEDDCNEDAQPKQHDVNQSANETDCTSKVDTEAGGVDVENEDSNATNDKSIEDIEDNVSDSGKSEESAGPEDVTVAEAINGLRNCSSCGKLEPSRKAFKKCQKCKQEGVQAVRYYCGRDCQVADWVSKHKAEHRDGLLV